VRVLACLAFASLVVRRLALPTVAVS
jgi:hypothetical protein